jgi:2-haloacid dehalogenase
VRASGFLGYLLDADNTLFDFDRAEREALAETLAAVCPAPPPPGVFAEYHRINAGLWKRFEQGEVDQAGLRVERFLLLFRSLGLAGDPRRAAELFVEALAGKPFLLPHARGVLEALARRAPLALLTNGLAAVQRGRIRGAGIGGLFGCIVISEEVGLAKPDPGIFLLAVEGLGLQAPEVLCVGDNAASDIRGARRAGLACCWLAPGSARYPPEEPPPDYRISDLRELLSLRPVPTVRPGGPATGRPAGRRPPRRIPG